MICTLSLALDLFDKVVTLDGCGYCRRVKGFKSICCLTFKQDTRSSLDPRWMNRYINAAASWFSLFILTCFRRWMCQSHCSRQSNTIQTKDMFLFSVSHQNTLCVSLSSKKCIEHISSLIKHSQSHFLSILVSEPSILIFTSLHFSSLPLLTRFWICWCVTSTWRTIDRSVRHVTSMCTHETKQNNNNIMRSNNTSYDISYYLFSKQPTYKEEEIDKKERLK